MYTSKDFFNGYWTLVEHPSKKNDCISSILSPDKLPTIKWLDMARQLDYKPSLLRFKGPISSKKLHKSAALVYIILHIST